MPQRTLTRADLCESLVRRSGVSRACASSFLNAFLLEVERAIVSGETVKIARFGSFVVRWKRERIGRNPKTGEEVPITPRRVVTFRPSQILRERVNPPPRKVATRA